MPKIGRIKKGKRKAKKGDDSHENVVVTPPTPDRRSTLRKTQNGNKRSIDLTENDTSDDDDGSEYSSASKRQRRGGDQLNLDEETDQILDEQPDSVIDKLIYDQLNLKFIVNKERSRRVAIAHFFTYEFHFPLDDAEWRGRDGVGAKICKKFEADPNFDVSHFDIYKVFEDIICFANEGIVYNGQRRLTKPARKVKIENDSPEAQIVADAIEDGFSYAHATRLLNKRQIEIEGEIYSNSAVYNLIKRLEPETVPIKRLQQGDYSGDSPWACRRYAGVYQHLIRMGFDLDPPTYIDDEGNEVVPDWYKDHPEWFDKEVLRRDHSYKIEDVSFWDETHRDCVIGDAVSMAGRKVQLKFRRNDQGGLDPKGKVRKKTASYVNVKFEKEVTHTKLAVREDFRPRGLRTALAVQFSQSHMHVREVVFLQHVDLY